MAVMHGSDAHFRIVSGDMVRIEPTHYQIDAYKGDSFINEVKGRVNKMNNDEVRGTAVTMDSTHRHVVRESAEDVLAMIVDPSEYGGQHSMVKLHLLNGRAIWLDANAVNGVEENATR